MADRTTKSGIDDLQAGKDIGSKRISIKLDEGGGDENHKRPGKSPLAVDEILATLSAKGPVKRVGEDKWMAHCPLHKDDVASLSISIWNGEIRVTCFAGCDWKRLRDALGLNGKDCMGGSCISGRKVVAVYIYRDEQGQPAYWVKRYIPKAFKVGCYENGKPIAGLNGQMRVLYNLHLLRRYPEALVIVCEGEKDAENATCLPQFVGTTCLGGARSKWEQQFTESLSGRRVFVVADADVAGRDYAWKVVQHVWRCVNWVYVVEFSNVAEGFDFSDWKERSDVFGILGRLAREADQTACRIAARTVVVPPVWIK